MVTGATESGFVYELEEESLDDYELLENLCDIDNGDVTKLVTMARRLLGEEQLESLKDHVRNEKGRVSMEKMGEEISQIIGGDHTGKNLLSSPT